MPIQEDEKGYPSPYGIDKNYVTTKVLGDGTERIETGDDDLECIKVTGSQLNDLANPENTSDKPVKIERMFKDADDDKEGVSYYYRKVLGQNLDKPVKDELVKVTPDTNLDDI